MEKEKEAWLEKSEVLKEALKELETAVMALEAEREKVEKELAVEAETLQAKKQEKAENETSCRLLVKSQNEKQTHCEQELGELKAAIAEYENSYRSAVVEIERVRQAIVTDGEAVKNAEEHLQRGYESGE